MVNILIIILKIVILLGFLVFIHEAGHFIIAKLCKVKVNEFAIGFGPVLLSKQGKETKYQLRAIPLGGFVSMEGEDEKSDDERSFNNISIPKRIAIVAAGGLVNIFFALIVYFGLQIYDGNNVTTQVNYCSEGSAAQNVGIQSGDIIKKINGKKVKRQTDINKMITNSDGNELTIEIERNGQKIEYKTKPDIIEYITTGIYLESENSTRIQGFDPNGSVKDQGFETGDVLISANDVNIENNTEKLSEIIKNNPDNEKIKFRVRRGREELLINVNPVKNKKYLLGVNLKIADNNFANNVYYAFLDTGDFASSIGENFKMIFRGEVSTSDFMGPIGISSVVAKTNGVRDFMYIMAVISLSLGVTNLLPFPPLDGGKVLLLIIEGIRKKPLEEKYELGIQMIGFGLLVMLSVYVSFNDVGRIL